MGTPLKNPLSGGFSLARLTPHSRGALFFNLALVLLIGVVWWMILKPESVAETATTPSTIDTTGPVAEDTPAPAPTTQAPPPAAPGETYTVASGDTLASIGAKLGVEWQKIADANGIKEPFALQVGQVLKIPRQ